MMKHLIKPKALPLLAFAGGAAGLGLHRLLYLLAVDQRDLLTAGHPVETLLWVLTAAVLGLAACTVYGLGGKGDYAANFPGSIGAAAGNALFAVCVLWTVLMQAPAMEGGMGQLWKWLGVLAAACLVWIAVSRRTGKIPCFAAHMAVCAFLTIHIVTHYRAWSGDPQLQDYVFILLGSVALLFFAYYLTAFDVGFFKRRSLMFSGLAAMYLCLAGLTDTPYTLLYGGAVLWVWSNFCIWQLPAESVD